MHSNRFRAVGVFVTLGIALGAGTAVQAQQILTAVESRLPGPGVEPRDALSSTVAGVQIGTTFGAVDTRALTDYGVNRIYAQGNASYRQYATSNWLDTYSVGGAAGTTVTVSFSFAIDGDVNVFDPFDGVNSRADVNFSVYALRGNGWSLGGRDAAAVNPLVTPIGRSLDNYTDLLLVQTSAGSIVQLEPGQFSGLYGYANNAGDPGAATGRATYDKATDIYTLEQQIGAVNRIVEFGKTTFRVTTNGVPGGLLPYSLVPALQTTRTNFEKNYAILDVARLCPNVFNYCTAGQYPGSNLSVSFDIAAGSTFTLMSSLHANDLYVGTIDFFHTAKVSGVSVSAGGTLTSDSGTLTALPDGSYGYPAALAPVPEPAAWSMLIAGFALVGSKLRRRRQRGLPVIAM